MSITLQFSKFTKALTASEIDNNDQPAWKVTIYSLAVIAALYLGMVLERHINVTRYTEILGAIPVLVCSLYFLKMPQVQPIQVRLLFRVILLSLPFLPLLFARYDFPSLSSSTSAVWLFIIIQSIAIGITEELTFRFNLQRLWSRYGAAFFVVASSMLFGLLHYPLGLQVTIIATIIGFAFSLSRVAGMPLIVLIFLHAFYDGPGIYASMGAGA